MPVAFRERLHALFSPPRYLAPPPVGIELSTSGVKAVRLARIRGGYALAAHAASTVPAGALARGEAVDAPAIARAVVEVARAVGAAAAHVGIPHEASEHPASLEAVLAVCDEAGVTARSLESEAAAALRALIPAGDDSTTLVIDIGKSSTKLTVARGDEPVFFSILPAGGHALTRVVQKHFGVTETEARAIKAAQGISGDALDARFARSARAAVAPIAEEIVRQLGAWRASAARAGADAPLTRALLVGGSASVRGLPEYLERTLKIPVALGDVFVNFGSERSRPPVLDHAESLAYASAIGLALRDAYSYAA